MRFSLDIGWIPNYISYEKLFDRLKTAGISNISYNFLCANNKTELLYADSYLKNAEEIRMHLDNAGITCLQCYAPFSLKLCDERLNRFEPSYGELVRALEFASVLGAKTLVCCAVQVPQNVSQVEKNYKIYRSLIPYCEKFGVRIAISSNFPKCINSSVLTTPWENAEDYFNFIRSFNSSYIAASVDIGDGLDNLVKADDFMAFFSKDMLALVNIKDSAKYRDVHTAPYFEQAGLDGFVKALTDIGYEGTLNLECPAFMEKYPSELLGDILGLFADIGRYICGLAEVDIL